MYDSSNPEIAQMLRDPDYWAALDAISGYALSVFYFHSPVAPSLSISNQDLLRLLGREEPLPAPALLLFQVDGGEVIDSRVVAINVSDGHAAFKELRRVLQIAAGSISNQPYGAPPAHVFDAVEAALRKENARVLVMKVVRVVKTVAELAAIGVTLAGGTGRGG